MVIFGRHEGLHGLFNTTFNQKRDPTLYWKFSFVFGLISYPFLAYLYLGSTLKFFGRTYTVYDPDIKTVYELNNLGWIISGFLIGAGSRMADNLTGAHGYCSSPIIHKKDVVATVSSFVAAFLAASLRHYLPFMTGGYQHGPYFMDTVSTIE